jgi:hypothetical protein
MAFPTLFPHGLGHTVPKRRVHVKFEDEIKHRLCTAASPFRNDFLYQFLAYDTIQKKQVF